MGLVSVLVAALAFQTGAPTNSMSSMRTVDQGTQSNIDEPRNVVIRSADEWSRLWRAHAADKPAPAVDFSREMVVGVFLGSRPTAGYSVQIVGTREQADRLVVEYRAGSPSRDMMTAQVITTPYHLVAVPKRTGEVRFEKIAASEPRP